MPQLFIDLRGDQPNPCRRPGSWPRVIRAFDPQTGQLSDEVDALGRHYPRGCCPGKKALLVLDNARDAEHLRAVAPRPRGCGLIATSRDSLTSLSESRISARSAN